MQSAHGHGSGVWLNATAFGLLLLASIGVKISVWGLTPQIFNDTPGYLVPAIQLVSGRGYGAQQDAFRSPTYPLLLAALILPLDHKSFDECTDAHRPVCIGRAGEAQGGPFLLRWIEAANILLGFGTVFLLYRIGWELTHSLWVALLAGAGYALNIATAFWENSLLVEALTTFLVVLAIYLALRARPNSGWRMIGLGVVLGALALCHQLYLAFWIPLALFLAWRERGVGVRRVLQFVAPVIIIPLLLIGGWSTYNYFVNGWFTPSTLSGYVLIQMVAPAMENAPEGYDGITQPYVGYRDAQLREVGTYAGAIFRSWRVMMSETDLTWSQISSKLASLSFYLAYHYPSVYVASVQQIAPAFWEFAFYHYEPVPPGAAEIAARFTDPVVQQLLNVLFWLSPFVGAGLLFVARARKQMLFSREVVWGWGLMFGTVMFAAIVSSLTNYGDNERYRAPVMPLQYTVILLTLWGVLQVARSRRPERGVETLLESTAD